MENLISPDDKQLIQTAFSKVKSVIFNPPTPKNLVGVLGLVFDDTHDALTAYNLLSEKTSPAELEIRAEFIGEKAIISLHSDNEDVNEIFKLPQLEQDKLKEFASSVDSKLFLLSIYRHNNERPHAMVSNTTDGKSVGITRFKQS